MRNLRRVMNQTWTLGGTGAGFSEPDIWDPRRLVWSSGPTMGNERVANDFQGYSDLYKSNGIAAACINVRMSVFSEIRFLWQERVNGQPSGPMFDSDELDLIHEPWMNGTTGELAARMEQDDSLCGNFFAAKFTDGETQQLARWYPPHVQIVTGSKDDNVWGSSAKVAAYIHHVPGKEPEWWSPESVVHYSPLPDPDARWRGMSWLTPVIEEILGDKAATRHKTMFFKRGANTNLAVTHSNARTLEQLKEYAEYFNEQFEGLSNAYKTIHLGAGADTTPLGATLRQLDFKATQGAGESRIAAASLLGAVMAQFSEGLAGSSLNAGNFDASRKRAETILFRPHWRIAAASLGRVLDKPKVESRRKVELVPDTSGVAFLQDAAKEQALVKSQETQMFSRLIRDGYDPASIPAAVATGNWELLVHTGLLSVQLQRPGTTDSANRIMVPAQAAASLYADGWVPVAANNGGGVLK